MSSGTLLSGGTEHDGLHPSSSITTTNGEKDFEWLQEDLEQGFKDDWFHAMSSAHVSTKARFTDQMTATLTSRGGDDDIDDHRLHADVASVLELELDDNAPFECLLQPNE